MDLWRRDMTEQRELFAPKKPTPAWLAHRLGLSDTPRTPPSEVARHQVLKRQAEASFKKWHEECQKRKARREVLAAKDLLSKGAASQRGKPKTQRKPASRLRCP